MKRNLVPLLGIAFVVALAASGIFYGVFVSQLRKAALGPAKQEIVVAVKPLDRGAVLKPADLKLTPWSGASPPGSLHRIEDAAGKTIYGSIEENEPVTEARVSAARSGNGIGIAKGMRALSIHVVDSAGLIPFLRAGNHVDVQVVKARSTPEASLRTILQNVEVLSVQGQEGGNGYQPPPATVTLLTSPLDADRVALADSGANIRLLLRNPLDEEEGTRPGMLMAALFSDTVKARPGVLPVARVIHAAAKATDPALPPPTPRESVEVTVRVGGASAHDMENLLASIPGIRAGQEMRVIRLPKDKEGQHSWERLEQQFHVASFSVSRLTAANFRESRVQAGKSWKSSGSSYGMEVRFEPRIGSDHILRLRVQPEIALPAGDSGVRIRKIVEDVNLEDGQSLLVTGLSEAGEMPALADRLFGERLAVAANRELLVLMTPHLPAGHSTIAAAGH